MATIDTHFAHHVLRLECGHELTLFLARSHVVGLKTACDRCNALRVVTSAVRLESARPA